MISIFYIMLILCLYFGIWIFAGMKLALAAFSVLMMAMAALFVLKKDSYYKYIKTVNPKYALIYSSKSEDFRKKHRVIDIMGFSIIAVILLFLAVIMPNISPAIQGTFLIYVIPATMLLTVVLWGLNLFILKKSNKNSKFWFYFIASILGAILVLAVIQSLIF